jgi:tRNA G18 (ribose-2'-O)-methylase SpoU
VLEPIPIADPDDPRLAEYAGLRDPERRMREEPAGGYLIAEGVIAITTLLASGRPVRSLLLNERELERLRPHLAAVAAPVYLAEREVFRAVTGYDVHRGALASADRFEPAPLPGILATARRVVVLEAIADNTNLGSIFRSAAAFGYDAVLLDPRCADPLYRRSVRVSAGHTLTVPFARIAPIPAGLGALRDAGFTVAALTPAETALDIGAVALPERLAVVLGTEGPGLTDDALAAADLRVRIPISPHVDSLNVAVATSIAMWALR